MVIFFLMVSALNTPVAKIGNHFATVKSEPRLTHNDS
jgi:hypothetical protein